MPKLVPNTAKHCSELLVLHQNDIKQGDYDIDISRFPINQLNQDELTFIASYCDSSKRYIALSPHAPATSLIILAKSKDKNIRCLVASNRNTPESILKTLAIDSDEDVKLNVTENPNITQSIWEELVNQLTINNKRKFAKQTLLPKTIYEKWVYENDVELRRIIAHRHDLSSDTFKILAKDKVKEVREAVLKNPKVPDSVLKMYKNDNDENNKQQAANLLKSRNTGCILALSFIGVILILSWLTFIL